MIGGNITAVLQKCIYSFNEIGEPIEDYAESISLFGFLDLSSGDSHYTNFNAKVQESTHIFICDYKDLNGYKADNSRLIVNDEIDEIDEIYDVTLIDDPMGLHQHLEIYLRYKGAQNEQNTV